MLFIPGWFVALLTFPGVICHEIAHRFFCDMAGVPVYAVRYFRVSNTPGYVQHAPTKNLKTAFLISVGPWIINTLLCALISFAAVIPIFILKVADKSFASEVLLWFGISMGVNAFPSSTDMANFRDVVKQTGARGFPTFVGKFFSRLFAIAGLLRFVYFDLIYAFVVASLVPRLVLGLWGSM